MIEARKIDLLKFKTWRNLGLLKDVDHDKLRDRCKNGSIIVGCGHGHQTPDFFRFLMQKVGCTQRPHLFMYDGGPLHLVKIAPIPKQYRIHDQLIRTLMLSRKLERIPTLLLCCHFPCEVAEKWHIKDLVNIIDYNIMAANFMIKKGWDPKKVITLFHCDHGYCDPSGGERKRTYFIDRNFQHLLGG